MPRVSKKGSKGIDANPPEAEKCGYMTRSRAKRIQEDNLKKRDTGSRGCSKKPVVSRGDLEEIRNGGPIRPGARRPVAAMPKLTRYPAIISHPVQPGAAEQSSVTRELEAVTSNHEERLRRVEAGLNIVSNHVTQVLTPQMLEILHDSNSKFEKLEARITRQGQVLEQRMADLSHEVYQRPLIHFLEVEDYHDDAVC